METLTIGQVATRAGVHKETIRYYQSLGHNHSSQLLSIGTSDTSVSARIVDFIEHPPSP